MTALVCQLASPHNGFGRVDYNMKCSFNRRNLIKQNGRETDANHAIHQLTLNPLALVPEPGRDCEPVYLIPRRPEGLTNNTINWNGNLSAPGQELKYPLASRISVLL